MTVQVFTVPSKNSLSSDSIANSHKLAVFFICFRECLETTIIVSVLLSFLKQALDTEANNVAYKRLTRQVK